MSQAQAPLLAQTTQAQAPAAQPALHMRMAQLAQVAVAGWS